MSPKKGNDDDVDGMHTSNDSVRLKIIIVGGGIAGLGAAITLSRAGHEVVVLEKSQSKKEAGFMITLGSNAVRVLKAFDFDFVRARAVDCPKVSSLNAHTLEPLRSYTIKPDFVDDDLIPRTMYRPGLHTELKRLAMLESAAHPAPVIWQGSEVLAVDIFSGTVKMEDGSKMSADLIVGADGERSLVTAAFEDGQLLRQAAYKIYRAIIPMEKLADNAKDLSVHALTKDSFAMFLSMDKQVSWFEGRDGELQDLEAGYLLSEDDDMKAERDPKKAYEKMMEKFSDIHPDLLNILAKADRVSDWEVHFSRPLPTLSKHKAVVIGDSAHSMYPTSSQGGSQSIEDVGCLGILLSQLESSSELQSRLKLYEKLRKPRVGTVQALSGVVFGTEKIFAKSRPWHPINKTNIKSLDDHVDFLYNYNILDESRKALEEHLQSRPSL